MTVKEYLIYKISTLWKKIIHAYVFEKEPWRSTNYWITALAITAIPILVFYSRWAIIVFLLATLQAVGSWIYHVISDDYKTIMRRVDLAR